MCACFLLWLITALTSVSILIIFKLKEFYNFSLFRCLFLMPTIAENPTSHMYEDENLYNKKNVRDPHFEKRWFRQIGTWRIVRRR